MLRRPLSAENELDVLQALETHLESLPSSWIMASDTQDTGPEELPEHMALMWRRAAQGVARVRPALERWVHGAIQKAKASSRKAKPTAGQRRSRSKLKKERRREL